VQNISSGYLTLGCGFDVNDDLNAATVSTVGATNYFEFDFHPILQAYVSSDYQETQMISSDIASPSLWKQDLTGVNQGATFTLTENANGSYTFG
jgi:hypothetical protein